jgi:PhnB protein
MSVEVYIYFNGNCRQAVVFYAGVFQTDLQRMLTYGEAAPNIEYPLPDEAKNRVLHTLLTINGSKIMFSDCTPDMEYIAGNNMSVMLNYKDEKELKAVFARLAEGGEVYMEPQQTFFSKCYGHLADKFGILWQFTLYTEE